VNLFGKWYLEFTVVIETDSSEEGQESVEKTVKIPLTVEASNVVNADKIAHIAEVLWGQLTRDMIAGYLDGQLANDEEVSIKDPRLVFEGKPGDKKVREI
jgi:hypothetical protein